MSRRDSSSRKRDGVLSRLLGRGSANRRARAKRPQSLTCDRCARPVLAGSARCIHCGNRLAAPPEPGPTKGPRLTGVEREILMATITAERELRRIFVLDNEGPHEGEIKAGNQRLYGSDAVAAVERLMRDGYVFPVEEACFALTREGVRVATNLV